MPLDTSQELVGLMLSHLRAGVGRSAKIYHDLGAVVEDAGVRGALQARVLLSDEILSKIDECFKLMGQEPVEPSGQFYDVFVEEFRHEHAKLRSSEARSLFVLAKASQLTHVGVGEYQALIAVAAATTRYRVAMLLDTCLEEELAFVERNQRLIRAKLRPFLAA